MAASLPSDGRTPLQGAQESRAPAFPDASGFAGSGWESLDELLGGGWPIGALSEVLGRGRSALALAAVRASQRAGQPVAWVDGPGDFCPATAGVDLERLTLVQPPRQPPRASRALFAADILLRSRAFGLLVLDLGAARGPLTAWFRLARLARTACCALLVLHGRPGAVAGSAADLAVRVRLRPVAAPDWADLPPPAREVRLVRRRGATGGGRIVLPAPG